MARGGHWKPYGQIVELEIEGVASTGEGVATLDGVRYRVWNALPGERVQARIIGRKTGWRLATREQILRPSLHRVEPRCAAFGTCGGCSWQSLDYPAQLDLLETRVRALFEEAGVDVSESVWAPIIGSETIFHYRGKIELTFGAAQGAEGEAGPTMLGFNRRGRYWEIVDIDECHIGPPVNAALIGRVREWARARGHAPYRQRRHEGFLRYLVVRQQQTASPQRWLAALVTTTPVTEDWGQEALVASLAEVEPAGSLLWVRCDATSQAVRVEACETLLGDGRLVERLGGVEYVLGLESFFQANARMAERLVDLVRSRVLAGRHDVVADLFCGVGTLALALADDCRAITGVEFVAAAVADAEANARARGWEHVRFIEGAAEKHVWDEDVQVVVLDPPRSGLHPRLPRRLLETPVARVVYVSCNPEALARDLAQLAPVYELVFARCIDMFPHTPHVETVVELWRRAHQETAPGGLE